ncbi:voltage-dependent calcium channel subunit alpha-2/delta-2-like isoform X3 [Petromyzon marinus]|uniref:voltage-dependent calcium channel subunit alpha-2/delta-2-like isoform X3 n=1 Tax=Petromyzon marinus TaxID=7757 RepID=UPI003F72AAF5
MATAACARGSALVSLALAVMSLVRADVFPHPWTIKQWAGRLDRELERVVRQASGVDQLKQLYTEHKHLFEVRRNDAQHLVESVTGEIEKVLDKKVKALERLARTAEELQRAHQWSDNIKEEDMLYYNAKKELEEEYSVGNGEQDSEEEEEDGHEINSPRIEPTFKQDSAFGFSVDKNHSAIHIPTDIYKASTIILNELNWTAGLDEVFKLNKEEDPTLLWQVFGSATGLTRFYPATPWVAPGDVDLFDVRRRPWYIQGASSPKDMVIIIDVSGSVSGLTLKLMKKSVSEMLETLSDDDYVNVASFHNEAVPVSCFNHLVQANVRNKQMLSESVEKLTAKGMTNYKAAFTYAFEQLLNTNVTRANCNKMIMMFTDGGEDRAQDVFENYNWPKKEVRVFTFSVGQHNYNVAPIQWMACANKGFYFEIPSIGAIRINTQDYLDVLGRPMVLAGPKAKKVQWTNVYKDALNLGLVITGTMPVFNISKNAGEQQNQLLLGVMGVDISLDDIKKLTTQYNLGPNGYFFAIDPNGYVLLHPNLKPKVTKFEEPVTLDFLDAELENDIKLLIRQSMIDKKSGMRTFEMLIKSLDERYIDKSMRTYTWTPMQSAEYSLALVLPSYSNYYIRSSLTDQILQAQYLEFLLPSSFETIGHVFIAPREYCKNLRPMSDNAEFLRTFIGEMEKKTPDSEHCNTDMIYNLILDAGITAKLAQTHWQKQNIASMGILTLFVATDGGITRVYPYSSDDEWEENPEPHESSYYKRSLDNKSFIYRATHFGAARQAYGANVSMGILASRVVDVNIDGKSLRPAVVGVKLNPEFWVPRFRLLTNNQTDRGKNPKKILQCMDNSCEMDCDSKSNILECVVLDDGGFLVFSNQESHQEKLGEFFGEVDPHLFHEMHRLAVYSRVESYDYQSVCDPPPESHAGAAHRSIRIPKIYDILNLAWWFSAAAWSLLQQLLCGITVPNLFSPSVDARDPLDLKGKVSCVMLQTQYYFPNNNKSFHKLIDCGNCTRYFHAEKLGTSNLVLVVAELFSKECTVCEVRKIKQAKQKSQGPDPCLLAETPRYRKGPDACFDYNVDDEPMCSVSNQASNVIPSTLALFFIPALVQILVQGLPAMAPHSHRQLLLVTVTHPSVQTAPLKQ